MITKKKGVFSIQNNEIETAHHFIKFLRTRTKNDKTWPLHQNKFLTCIVHEEWPNVKATENARTR